MEWNEKGETYLTSCGVSYPPTSKGEKILTIATDDIKSAG